jgi:hypothetical protein
MAKAVYGRLFGWIVNKINQLLAPEIEVDPAQLTEIGNVFNFTQLTVNSLSDQSGVNAVFGLNFFLLYISID